MLTNRMIACPSSIATYKPSSLVNNVFPVQAGRRQHADARLPGRCQRPREMTALAASRFPGGKTGYSMGGYVLLTWLCQALLRNGFGRDCW